MTLRDLMRKLPLYSTVHVHDKNGDFGYVGTPHQFIAGSIANALVNQVIPLDSYRVEVIVEEADIHDQS